MNIMDVLLLAQEIQASDGISELTSMYFLLSRQVSFQPFPVLDIFSRVLNEPIEELLNSHEKEQYLLDDISEPQNRPESQFKEIIIRDTSLEPIIPKGSRLKIDTSVITDEGLVAVKLIGSKYPVVALSRKDPQTNEYVLEFPNKDFMPLYLRMDEDIDKIEFIGVPDDHTIDD